MHRATIRSAILLALGLPVLAAAQAPSLTIYSGDFESLSQYGNAAAGHALVRERHRFELRAGADTISLSGLPRQVDVAGVDLRPLGAAEVLGQRFDFALASQDALLERAIGQTVTVEQAVGNSRERHTGTLLAAGNGLTLALPDGRVRVLSSYAGFELAELPEGLHARPTLQWQVRSDRAGAQDFELDYPTAGLAWRAEYRIDLDTAAACRMQLGGHAQVANRSGADFRDAQLTLVAGEPRRVGQGAPAPTMRMRAEASYDMAMAAPAAPVASGEYHAYRIPAAADLPDGSIQRIALMPGVEAATCERRYEVQTPLRYHRGSSPLLQREIMPTGETPVTVNLAFDNSSAAGLGRPLPAGRVRVFQGAGDLLGEAHLDHTAVDEEVRLELGTVFDINAERRHEDFSLDRSGRTLTETISLRLSNAKSEAVRVRVDETLPRWSDWEVVEASQAHEKTDAQTIRFDVQVPAGGETTLRYTVRYRWAPDVRTP